MAKFSTTDEGRAMTRAVAGPDLFYYLSVIDVNETPDEVASLFFGCYQNLEREGGPGEAGLKNMFRRLAESVPVIHAEAVRRGLVRQVDA
jgi:hypothetical protein